MTLDLTLPKWDPAAHERPRLSEGGYLAWLAEERARIISQGLLETVRADVARRPVDARFVWR